LLVMCLVLVVAGYDKTGRKVTAANGRSLTVGRWDGIFSEGIMMLGMLRRTFAWPDPH
jgi:hypothetical protein